MQNILLEQQVTCPCKSQRKYNFSDFVDFDSNKDIISKLNFCLLNCLMLSFRNTDISKLNKGGKNH